MIVCGLSIAPRGCFRVIGVDIVNDERYIVGDYNKEEALRRKNEHNARRSKKYWCRDDLYFVYDDQGRSVTQ